MSSATEIVRIPGPFDKDEDAPYFATPTCGGCCCCCCCCIVSIAATSVISSRTVEKLWMEHYSATRDAQMAGQSIGHGKTRTAGFSMLTGIVVGVGLTMISAQLTPLLYVLAAWATWFLMLRSAFRSAGDTRATKRSIRFMIAGSAALAVEAVVVGLVLSGLIGGSGG